MDLNRKLVEQKVTENKKIHGTLFEFLLCTLLRTFQECIFKVMNS